jgi:hypothetical protein
LSDWMTSGVLDNSANLTDVPVESFTTHMRFIKILPKSSRLPQVYNESLKLQVTPGI